MSDGEADGKAAALLSENASCLVSGIGRCESMSVFMIMTLQAMSFLLLKCPNFKYYVALLKPQ